MKRESQKFFRWIFGPSGGRGRKWDWFDIWLDQKQPVLIELFGCFWSNQSSNYSDFSAPPSWMAKYSFHKEIFWFPLLSQVYFIIQIVWLWLDNHHNQWRINYQLRLNMTKCPILGIYFAWLQWRPNRKTSYFCSKGKVFVLYLFDLRILNFSLRNIIIL